MGVYACLLISLLLVLQTVGISSLSINASNSFQYESLSNSNHSFNSIPPLQTHHHQQVLVVSGRGGGEENKTMDSWTVLKAKGGRSGTGAAGANNHRPGKANQKNAASSLMNSNNIIMITTLLLSSYLYLF